MPRPGPRRPLVALRLSAEEIADTDRRALDEGLTIRDGEPNRSEMLRIMRAYAAEHMPEGWRPDPKGTAMTEDLAARFAALVSIETRAVVDSLVEHEIEREYQTGNPTARAGARMLALAGIQMDWHDLFVEVNGSDRGLNAAADMHLRTMVREGLDARVCQCPKDSIFDRRADGHGHRGKCENHFEADVPPVDGNKLCGNCYCAQP